MITNTTRSEKRPVNSTQLRDELYVAVTAALVGKLPTISAADHYHIASLAHQLTEICYMQYTAPTVPRSLEEAGTVNDPI